MCAGGAPASPATGGSFALGFKPNRAAARLIGMGAQDFKLAVRGCVARPAFSLMVIGMLGLGIAGNAAIFSVVNGLFLRPLPFEHPERLVDLNERARGVDLPYIYVSDPDADAWRRGNTTFDAMAFYEEDGVNLAGRATAERARGVRATAGLLEVLRVRPLLGRGFGPQDERPGAAKVALLGYSLWQRLFGGDPRVLGETLRISNVPHTIVGVLPKSAVFPSRADVWTPLTLDTNLTASYWRLRGVGRLKPGVTIARGSADLLRVHRGLVAMGRRFNEGTEPLVQSLRDRYLGSFRASSRALLGAVGVVLLIACVNVAGLTIVRASGRSREIAIRAALGATRFDLLRPLFAETLTLASAGGVLGLLLGVACLRGMLALMPPEMPDWIVFGLDLRFALFCLALTAAAALVCGVAPALGAAKADLRGALHEGGARSSLSPRRRAALGAIAVFEVALAVVLLVGAGLLLQAFRRVLAVDPGFHADQVVGFRIALPEIAYPDAERRVAFADALLEHVRAIPGVTAAGAASYLPLEPADMTGLEVEGRTPRPNEQDPAVVHIAATSGYVEAIGMRLVAGRAFEARDAIAHDPGVAIVTEGFARWAWPGRDPIGRRIRNHGAANWIEVVGVVRDVRQVSLEQDARMAVYEPYPQLAVPYLSIALRSCVAPQALVGQARAAVRALDPDLPLFDVMSMDERVSRSLWARRATSWLIGCFAAVALALAAAGLYGVLSYTVNQRVREIAIRVALGARSRDVLGDVLARGMALAGSGSAIGLVVVLWTGRLLQSLLFGVSPSDPATLAAVVLVVTATVLVANLVPARRAAAVDPNRVLRSE